MIEKIIFSSFQSDYYNYLACNSSVAIRVFETRARQAGTECRLARCAIVRTRTACHEVDTVIATAKQSKINTLLMYIECGRLDCHF